MAQENRTWGYRQIVGALNNLGHEVSHQTVGNVLQRHGLLPAPERERRTSWREFIRTHSGVLAAVDFFTAEVWTSAGWITDSVLAFMRVGSRQFCLAAMTPSPDQEWMKQMARNMTLADTGFLSGCKFLLHDRDTKFRSAFDGILAAVRIEAFTLPPRSPNLNAHCERWIRSVKTELLSNRILIGERSLRHCLKNCLIYFHAERNTQGKDNVILFPQPQDRIGETSGPIQNRDRLGGLLIFYYREAA